MQHGLAERGVIRNHGGRQHYVPANVQIEVSGDSVEEGHDGRSQSGKGPENSRRPKRRGAKIKGLGVDETQAGEEGVQVRV